MRGRRDMLDVLLLHVRSSMVKVNRVRVIVHTYTQFTRVHSQVNHD